MAAKTKQITLDNISEQAIRAPVPCLGVQIAEADTSNPTTRYTVRQPNATDDAYQKSIGATSQLNSPTGGSNLAEADTILGYVKLLDVASATFNLVSI